MSYVPLRVDCMHVAGLQESMIAMKLPKNGLSDTIGNVLGPDDARLAGNLIRAGSDHAKAMRGIVAWLYLEMQTGWMIEFETYRHGVECLSTSSTMHGELVGLSGPELAEAKQAGLSDKVYSRVVTASYQVLRAMYKARRTHRHPDWQIFCNFVEDLPWFVELINPRRKKHA